MALLLQRPHRRLLCSGAQATFARHRLRMRRCKTLWVSTKSPVPRSAPSRNRMAPSPATRRQALAGVWEPRSSTLKRAYNSGSIPARRSASAEFFDLLDLLARGERAGGARRSQAGSDPLLVIRRARVASSSLRIKFSGHRFSSAGVAAALEFGRRYGASLAGLHKRGGAQTLWPPNATLRQGPALP
jgi:hypothetical protein